MDGMSGSNTLSHHHVLSPITLALMEDSGWYTVTQNNLTIVILIIINYFNLKLKKRHH